LGPQEELDTSKLDAMKTALDDLKIIDVARKPAGLTADLKATGSIKPDDESFASLAKRGFYLLRTGPKTVGLYSNKGEIVVQMKDGVEYVLRFGGIAGASTQDKGKDAKKGAAKDKKDEEPTGPGVDRYLFVMAEFNPDLIPKPVYEKLPDEKAPAEKPEAKKPEAKKKAEKKDEKKDEKPAVKGAPGEKGKPGKTDDADKADAKPDESAADKDNKDDAKKVETEKDAAKKVEPKKVEPKKDETKKDEKKPDLKAERERIGKENKRKQEEYDEKLKKGQEKATELNARFAQWYYVISDDVYRKIHITRDQIVKKKEKPKDDKGKEKDKEAGHDHDHDHEDDAEAKIKPSEKEDNPLGELDKLKKEGPGGKE
jgi:hypothetical protein